MNFLLPILLSAGVFANSFELKHTSNRFTLTIDSRKLQYISEKQNVSMPVKKCNLHLVRALNAELMGLVPLTSDPKGLPFQVDGNTFQVPTKGKESIVLLSLDQRIIRFQLEEKKSCAN